MKPAVGPHAKPVFLGVILGFHADAVVIACLGKAVGEGGKKEGQDGERHGVKLIFHSYLPLLLL